MIPGTTLAIATLEAFRGAQRARTAAATSQM